MAKLDVKKLIRGKRLPTSWSLSRYGVWRDCALRYALKFVVKLPDPPSSAMERGINIHAKAESYLLGKIKGMPPELKNFDAEMKALRRMKVKPEESWCIREDGTPTAWDDWSGVWLRAKIDAHHLYEDEKELLIIDFKTGRVKQYEAQRSMYAWLGMLLHPEVKKVSTELWFTDHGEVDDGEYKRREFKAMDKKWRDRAKRMLEDREFAASPGDACRWCPYRDDKVMANGEQGPCGLHRAG